MCAAFGCDRSGDLADDAVLRRHAAVGKDDRVAHGTTAADGDDDLIRRRGFLPLMQLEAGQSGGGPGVRLDHDGTSRIRFLQDERNRDVGDDAVDSRKGGDVAHRVDRQRRALPEGNRQVLRHIHLLWRTDHDVDRGVALGRQPSAHAGFDEHAEARHQCARDEHRDRHADEASAVMAKVGADKSPQTQRPRHHHSPNALMRALICAGSAPSRYPAKAPSARKMVRSACAATTGSWVTTTTV